MKKSFLYALTMAVVALTANGCVSSGINTSTHLTNVELGEPNYRLVARSVTGEAQAGYLLGFTWGAGMFTQVVSIARISGEKALYKAAMDNLWQNFETKYGSVEGKKYALVNLRYDTDALNLIVYTQPHITIQADVVEFGTQP